MGWRTVVITKGSKLDLKLNNLVIRSIEDVIKINLEEIEMLILESNQISITSCLLVELSKQKIPTVFCDDKHIPISSLLPFYGCHDCSKKVLLQTKWTDHQKAKIWSIIVYNKIFNQKKLLEYLEQNGPIYMSSCNLSNAPVCKTIEDAKLIFPEIKNIYNFGKMTQQPSQIIREILRK